LFIDFLTRKERINFSIGWLAWLGLLIINIPGLLIHKMRLSDDSLATPLGLLGLHSERILVFTMFWALLFLLWNMNREGGNRAEVKGRSGSRLRSDAPDLKNTREEYL
jgi:hypothetical protein